MAGICAATFTNPTAFGTAPQAPIDKQVDEAHDDLADANAKVNEVTAELEAAEKQLVPAQVRLSAAQAAAATADAAAKAALAALEVAKSALAAVQAEVAKIEQEIAAIRAQIASLARVIYTTGGQYEEIQVLLDSRDPAEFTERLAAIRRVSLANSNTFDQLAAAQMQLQVKLSESRRLKQLAADKEAEATQRANESASALNEADQAKQVVDQLVAQKSAIVAKADSERDAVRTQYAELKAEQARIAAAIKAAEAAERARQREKAKQGNNGGGNTGPSNPGPGTGGGTPVTGTGALAWPLPGRKAGGRTGPRVHPIYGYSSCHTGDDIGAPSGTPIKAAAAGTVISTTSGGPYGNNTLISHGGGLVTMYAHQSRFGVKKGDVVSKGQTMGYVGSTGYSTGPHLHFEVHVNGVPWEPMGWFGESKHRVSCA
ncbi:MAG: peptidoglycan DD-metalloendopeptidase family protein [Candidatus Nanopelagicales bacterium]